MSQKFEHFEHFGEKFENEVQKFLFLFLAEISDFGL